MEYSFTYLEKYYQSSLTDKKLLELGILNLKGEITYEGTLLSDQCSHKIKIIDYQNKNNKTHYLSGSILCQYEVLNEIAAKLSTEFKIPLKSILEALVNTVLHKDYSYSGDTLVKIYEDRLEITSLGGLKNDLTIEGIKLGISECRNLVLMNVFQELNISKGNGEGISTILLDYQEHKIKPIFRSIGGVFQVVLPRLEYMINGKVIDEKYRKILRFIEENRVVSNKDIQKYMNIKSTTTINYLKKMLELELIEKIRNGRNISYRVKKIENNKRIYSKIQITI